MSQQADTSMERTVAGASLVGVLAITASIVGLAGQPAFELNRSGDAVVQVDPSQDPQRHAEMASERIVKQRFQQAAVMLHSGRHEYAATALHRVLELRPRMPEAHVNMGFAMIGLERYEAARRFFEAATELKPEQHNAYWGLAVALEGMDDLRGALGAMRTYIHLAPPEDEAYVRKARSALWEWEETLERGPLPEEEKQWIKRRGAQWEVRHRPQDRPQAAERALNVQSSQSPHASE